MAEVRLQEGESLENALRRFKRKVQQEDIIKEVKRHSFYLKPGEKKRVKEALARKRSRKKARKEADRVIRAVTLWRDGPFPRASSFRSPGILFAVTMPSTSHGGPNPGFQKNEGGDNPLPTSEPDPSPFGSP